MSASGTRMKSASRHDKAHAKVSGTLARFVIPGGAEPGDILAFESANPTRVSIQSFAGQELNKLTFRLVDQDNNQINDLSGEHYSAVVLISYD